MTLTQVWGTLLIVCLCPIIGSLPLTGWIVRLIAGKKLSSLGTGNVSVSAAFYHGGRTAGVLAVLIEAFKGIGVVLLARYFFPTDPGWELIALAALVLGRFWSGQGAGTTNVTWGYIVHDWRVAGLTLLIGGISFTLIRSRKYGKYSILVLLPLLTLLLYPRAEFRLIAAAILSLIMAWIYHEIPDDLDLSEQSAASGSKAMFRFLQGDRAVPTLDQTLETHKAGAKAATLSQLKRWGYPVPMGWIVRAGDDPAAVAVAAQPSGQHPVVVRSSAVGEDTETASAAGQYTSLLNVTSAAALETAIAQCLNSYNSAAAVAYRERQQLPDAAMAVLVQRQIDGVFSGVAFSRDPISRQGEAVVIEALPGGASRVVSGRETPEQYRVWMSDTEFDQAVTASISAAPDSPVPNWQLADEIEFTFDGTGDVPPRLIQQIAFLARHLEAHYHGIPQDIEWTFDGQQIWLLQSRPVTTLLPIWTRKIAAEVIPGVIHPLTWSINRPLTCGVWGDLFTLVLSDRARDLDFKQTATLHHSRAYFNASLLGQIFRRMGLPAESLEFLTRGAKFSRPPITSTLRNTVGLLRLVQRELRLARDFEQDQQRRFQPSLSSLAQRPAPALEPTDLLTRIETILDLLRGATYYSILAPLSLAVRQGILQVSDNQLDSQSAPEVASLRSLHAIAEESRSLVSRLSPNSEHSSTVFAALAESPDGQPVLEQIDRFLEDYGYLSEVATDIAVPRWQENPHAVREMFTQFLLNPQTDPSSPANRPSSWKIRSVQQRLDLKGAVTEVYSRLLAELRYTILVLEQRWLAADWLTTSGDIFFLEIDEIRQLVGDGTDILAQQFRQRIAARRSQFEQDNQLTTVPNLVYGNDPPLFVTARPAATTSQMLQGIAASPGQVEGRVKVVRSLQSLPQIDADTLLVVPYTDAGWAPLLARASGVIADVGGRLSHGAIVAREYGIPAVMNVADATSRLQDGQWIRLDGSQGIIEVLGEPSPSADE